MRLGINVTVKPGSARADFDNERYSGRRKSVSISVVFDQLFHSSTMLRGVTAGQEPSSRS